MGPSKPGFPWGTFACTIGDVECAMELAPPTGTSDHGRPVLTSHGGLRVEGTYKVSGDEVALTDVAGLHACTGDEQMGTYNWRREGDTPSFTLIEVRTQGHRVACSRPWIRQERNP